MFQILGNGLRTCDGFTRRDIHPSRFDARSFAALEVGDGMKLVSVKAAWFGWALIGHWKRVVERRA